MKNNDLNCFCPFSALKRIKIQTVLHLELYLQCFFLNKVQLKSLTLAFSVYNYSLHLCDLSRLGLQNHTGFIPKASVLLLLGFLSHHFNIEMFQLTLASKFLVLAFPA